MVARYRPGIGTPARSSIGQKRTRCPQLASPKDATHVGFFALRAGSLQPVPSLKPKAAALGVTAASPGPSEVDLRGRSVWKSVPVWVRNPLTPSGLPFGYQEMVPVPVPWKAPS